MVQAKKGGATAQPQHKATVLQVDKDYIKWIIGNQASMIDELRATHKVKIDIAKFAKTLSQRSSTKYHITEQA